MIPDCATSSVWLEANDFPVGETKRGRYQQINLRDAYVDHLFGYINVKTSPLKLVINSGNGAAGPVVDAIEARFKSPRRTCGINQSAQHAGRQFSPTVFPNPLLPECRDDTRNAVIKHGADMGIAFDGDFDRCFLFDEKGQFIEGYYICRPAGRSVPRKIPARRSSTIRVSPGTPLMW